MYSAEFRQTQQHSAKTRRIHGRTREEDASYSTIFERMRPSPGGKVVVAVRAAEKDISKTALTWALTNIVRPGDQITLLAVFSTETRGRKLWNLPILNGDCAGRTRETSPDRMYQISDSFSQMVLQFHNQNEVGIKIKMVSGTPAGVVALESKRAGANWVVLDKHLKQEEKLCMEDLQCNIVVMKRSRPRILRLNLGGSGEIESSFSPTTELKAKESQGRHSSPVSSPDEPTTSFSRTTTDATSLSSSEAEASPFFVSERNPLFEINNAGKPRFIHRRVDSDHSLSSLGSVKEDLISSISRSSVNNNNGNKYWFRPNHTIDEQKNSIIKNSRTTCNNKTRSSRTLREKFVQFDEEKIQQPRFNQTPQTDHIFNEDVRDAVFLSRITTAPPPLCSLCQHRAPVFGKPPRWFCYKELEEATNGFSEADLLAEGVFGSVHRGVLSDGQVVAVKQLKIAGSQGEDEFRREVGVLSCAQHRNVVMLVGFCIEGNRRVLVYEYVCNGSLDFHLYGHNKKPLDWKSRLKIAIGAARGLRYLHEDCRVGCIVHRDMRPNNILLTHDFEPLVGDFGLAKWQPDLEDATEQRVVGTLGYLAPEYIEGDRITEKADVYAFGVVLMELIIGRKTIGMARSKGRQFLVECSRPQLVPEEQSQDLAINHQLLDPNLDSNQIQNFSHQLRAMAQAASLCLRRDPESRPSMSKVLRILEGGDSIIPLGSDSDSIGSRSQRLLGLSSRVRTGSRGVHSRKLSH
ncbi:hypothetical protein MKW94_028020 [Papaver nudicaule]|uniref:Protein kinase domain-containing protein n=1 Tax=Papaver nudicaule TaxID=74823 RepID=A0AA41VU63_PAPNU|nr:hypothetical protein [Papaver nudicaule]